MKKTVKRTVFGAALAMLAAFLVTLNAVEVQSIRQAQEQLKRLKDDQSALTSRMATLTEDVPGNLAPQDLWSPSGSVSADMQLQSWALSATEASMLNVTRITPMRRAPIVSHPVVGIELEAEGTLRGTVLFLQAIEAATPPLSTANLVIRRGARQSEISGETLVTLSLGVWGFTGVESE